MSDGTRKDDPVDDPVAEALTPQVSESRRRLNWAILAGSGAVIGAALGIPVVGLLLWPVTRREPPRWKPVGPLATFPLGETVPVTFVEPDSLPWAGFAAAGGAFVRREADGWVALSSYCTHTGCPVRWEEGANLFLCPCHAGAFNRDGAVVSGPPPEPLERLEVRVADGQVQVRGGGVLLGKPSTGTGTGEEQARSDGACPFARRGSKA